MKQRNGTDADRDNLRITLRQLEFEVGYNETFLLIIIGILLKSFNKKLIYSFENTFQVNVYNDLPFKEMERILEQASAETNHSDHDCIFIAVLSHGELGILYASDHAYKPDRLWTHFNAEKCPTLAGRICSLEISNEKIFYFIYFIT